MTILARVIIVCGIAILAYQAIAAAASGALGIAYTKFAFGSYAIYAAAGFTAGRYGPLWWGAAAGAAVAAIEGFFGWRLAAVVGPDVVRLGLHESHASSSWVWRLLALALVGAGLGLVGGAYAHWRRRRREPQVTA